MNYTNDKENIESIKPIEPILAVKAHKEYTKYKQDFLFHRYFMEELKNNKKPIILCGHVEIDI